jgi:hypothetical protein
MFFLPATSSVFLITFEFRARGIFTADDSSLDGPATQGAWVLPRAVRPGQPRFLGLVKS